MKKLFSFLIIAVLLLSSCNSEPSDSDENRYTKNYLYAEFYGTIYKINVESGKASPLCPDPLCDHDKDSCPFYSVGGTGEVLAFDDRYAYYLAGQSDPGGFNNGNDQLRRFDFKTGNFDILYREESGLLTNMMLADRYIFMNVQSVDDGKIQYHVMRYDLQSKKAEYMASEPSADCPIPLYFDGNRVLWSTASGECFSTDPDYKDQKPESASSYGKYENGGYRYSLTYTGKYADTEFPGKSLFVNELSCENIQTGETKVIAELSCTPIIYENKIIYCKYDPIVIGKRREHDGEKYTDNTITQYDNFGGKFYISEADGSDERLLCDINSAGNLYDIPFYSIAIVGSAGKNDWIDKVINCYAKSDDGYIERTDNKVLLINIKTGEYKMCEVK